MRFLVVLITLSVSIAVARADSVEVFQLKYRTAEQLIPTLRPLVEPGGAISGMQGTLVVRASRANLAQLREVVASLDTLPRRLLISVRQDSIGAADIRGAGVAGTVGGGDVRVGIDAPARAGAGLSVGIVDSRVRAEDRVASQVQALEGNPAFISTGQTIPVETTTVTPTIGGGAIVQNTTVFQNLSTGFYVIPRVAGDRVFLDIAPSRATPGQHGPGSADFQQIVTTAGGRLGEWFPLGGVDQGAAASRSGVLAGTAGVRSGSSSVWVKVDEIR